LRLAPWLVLGGLYIIAIRLALYAWSAEYRTDFDLLYYAGTQLLQGQNPYLVATNWYPLFYPMPAVLLSVPFTALPIGLARPVFDILAGLLFAFALVRARGPYALLALLSGTYLYAMRNGQTTPLMVAAGLLPACGFLLAVKPNTGLGLWLSRPHRTAVIGVIAFLAVSLVVLPSWPRDWWAALQQNNAHLVPPIMRPFGWLLLLAGTSWRTPEGRLLLAVALIPQSTLPHELVPLAIIPANVLEMSIYVAGSWVALVVTAMEQEQAPSIAALASTIWPTLLVTVYLPMLWLVLRRQHSSWLESRKKAVMTREPGR
jgi:hypothetical protein